MVAPSKPRSSSSSRTILGLAFLPMLILLNILCFQWGKFSYESSADIELTSSASLASLSLLGSTQSNDPLQPQQGNAVNLPSIRVEDPKLDRSIYGGAGDKKHLGGFTEVDIHGISPYVWRRMVTEYGIKSVIDVGCGRGVSTLWFHLNGLDALCVEGSHDAYVRSMLPDPSTQMVEHDFSRGPWWPSKTYDAVWCVEFLEHVGRNLHQNYLPIFRKAAIIFATHSQWGGWHHVEVHQDDWWIRKFELYGFKYMPDMTAQVREEARQEAFHGPLAVNGEKPNPQNLYNVLVFFNPAVGALPQHAHLFAEPGCFKSRINGNSTLKDCGTGVGADGETPLPPEYLALPIVEANQKRWEERVQSFIQPKTRL